MENKKNLEELLRDWRRQVLEKGIKNYRPFYMKPSTKRHLAKRKAENRRKIERLKKERYENRKRNNRSYRPSMG